MNDELLRILCCPETHQPLAVASGEVLQRLNLEIAAGRLKNRAGKSIATVIDGGLIRQDGRFLYPVRNSIPVLLIAEAIPL
jgi:uncharacterized protein YbaR (Trm112 family)